MTEKYVIMLASERNANPDSHPIAEEGPLPVLMKVTELEKRVRFYYDKSQYQATLLDPDEKYRTYEIVRDGTEKGAIYKLT